MTALDRAIIKAYHRPKTRAGETSSGTARSGTAVVEAPSGPHFATRPTVPLSQALAGLAVVPEAPATPLTDEPARLEPASSVERKSAEKSPPPPVGLTISAMLDQALAVETAEAERLSDKALDNVSGIRSVPPVEGTSLRDGTANSTAVPSPTMTASDLDPQIAAARYTEIPGPGDTFTATTVTVRSLPPHQTSESPSAAIDVIAVTSEAPAAAPAQTVTIAPAPVEPEWQPLLQVDRVAWPSIHDRLLSTASAAIDQLAAGLLSICESGSKTLGLASSASGEGVTTLLLAAARKLLSQGRKIVLVDAHWDKPHVAQSLGLLPQIGWEETLCGGLPLEEVVIESLEDGLAVLPIREPPAAAVDTAKIAASFDILAREFDIVLVDLGVLGNRQDEDRLTLEVAARMDAVVLVQNVRVTTPNRLADAREQLAAANVRHAGTIQNFVAG
jgi:Mrp family chromosome partitioning ATPase